jgi:hypothetical protein
MLQRNLLYTFITRDKRLVVLVGSRKACSVDSGATAGHGAALGRRLQEDSQG